MDLQGYPPEQEEAYFASCIRDGRVYFGPVLAAFQGLPVRHYLLQEMVAGLARTAGRPLRVLEIGSWAGGSAITIGRSLAANGHRDSRLYCVDPWIVYGNADSGHVAGSMARALENGSCFQLFLHNVKASGLSDVIVTMRGKSRDVLPALSPGLFDLAFVDGDHSFEAVRDDLSMTAPLLRDGGILCGDDLEKQFADVDAATCMAALDRDYITDAKTGDRYHPGVTRAVHDVIGPVSESFGFWAVRKTGNVFSLVDLPSTQSATEPGHFKRPPA